MIPEVRNAQDVANRKSASIDLTKGMEDLFADYFKHKYTQEPNDRLINLFREALASEEDE